MSKPDAFLTLAELSEKIHLGELSSHGVTQSVLQRIEEHNPEINCYLRVFTTTALENARRLDQELRKNRWRGPLHGVPIAIKDIFDFPGHSASGGSKLPRDETGAHATLIRKLEAAGAVIVGALNLDELAAGGSGDNIHFGRCKNPWNPAHNTGGSSGGSAAAVAAGLAYAAIGSDAGGSIRIPAAFCGTVGLKPTYGRVSRYGALARTWSMDCIGPITRSSLDAAIVFNAILGQDPLDATSVISGPVKYDRSAEVADRLPKIGIFDASLENHATPADPNLDNAMALLEQAGYQIQPTGIADLDLYTELQQVVVKSEGAAMHGRALRDNDPRMSHAVRSVIEGGLEIPAVRYIEALSMRGSLLQSFATNVMGEIDVLAMPVSVPTAPLFEPQNDLQANLIDEEFSRMATMTRFANYLGVPAISLPTGVDTRGMPTAIQLVGRPFEESLLLQTAAHYESLRGAINYPGESDPA